LRDAIEFVAHAHAMIIDPQLQAIWLNKTADKEAFSKAFEHANKRGIFKGLNDLHEKWRQLSELGSHATIGSILIDFMWRPPKTASRRDSSAILRTRSTGLGYVAILNAPDMLWYGTYLLQGL
jgi:hypothetical protein